MAASLAGRLEQAEEAWYRAQELERAVTTLGMRGAVINSHTKGEYLDSQKFWPILEAAQALDVPIPVDRLRTRASGQCSSPAVLAMVRDRSAAWLNRRLKSRSQCRGTGTTSISCFRTSTIGSSNSAQRAIDEMMAVDVNRRVKTRQR